METPTKLRSVLLFDVSGDTPHKILTRATDEGLSAARGALPGSVDANGQLGGAREGTRRVRIELALRIDEGGPAAGMDAERAFADAFIARVRANGFEASRV